MFNRLLLFVLFLVPVLLSAQRITTHQHVAGCLQRIDMPERGALYVHHYPGAAFIELLDAWQNLQKVLPLPVPAGRQVMLTEVLWMSDLTDKWLELGVWMVFSGTDKPACRFALIRENGRLLLQRDGPGYYPAPLRVNGRLKLICENEVYSLPGLHLEHRYENSIRLLRVDNRDYYAIETGNPIRVYNDDHTFWQIKLLPGYNQTPATPSLSVSVTNLPPVYWYVRKRKRKRVFFTNQT